jgi:hypothetical protein
MSYFPDRKISIDDLTIIFGKGSLYFHALHEGLRDDRRVVAACLFQQGFCAGRPVPRGGGAASPAFAYGRGCTAPDRSFA